MVGLFLFRKKDFDLDKLSYQGNIIIDIIVKKQIDNIEINSEKITIKQILLNNNTGLPGRRAAGAGPPATGWTSGPPGAPSITRRVTIITIEKV